MAAAPALTLSAAEVAALPVGVATCLKIDKVALLAIKDEAGGLRVAPNTCAHMHQTLSPDVEDAAAMKCTLHGAKLDMKTMTCGRAPRGTWSARSRRARAAHSLTPRSRPTPRRYTAGPAFMSGLGTKIVAGTTKQPECAVTVNADGSATLVLPAAAAGGGGCAVC